MTSSSCRRQPSTHRQSSQVEPESRSLSAEQIAEQLADRWRRGDRQPVEVLLNDNPQWRNNQEAAVALIYEEFCLREESGESVTEEEYFQRFPEWRGELAVLFNCHQLIDDSADRVAFPAAGQWLGEFNLLAKLGQGAQGQVFLARQPLLNDRLVVLKVTSRSCDEPLLLSQLQHTHIVPLYCVLEDTERNLTAFCMPYVGGATLQQVFESFPPGAVNQRRGRHFLTALDQCDDDERSPVLAAGRSRSYFSRASYPQAVSWIFACLAEALAYLHQRGLVHLDIKPSNVLIAADAQPMLIDFHMAREPLTAGAAAPSSFGGTYLYMSPEQSAAMEAIGAGRSISRTVDGRSDLYSLGLVMYEALGGRPPADQAPRRSPLRKLNPDVSPGLSAIVDRCLAEDPQDRYPDAHALATDLRRHLADLPLRFTANHDLSERWKKWRRRRPYGLPLVAMLALLVFGVLGTGLFGWLQVSERITQAQLRLEESDRLVAGGNSREALRSLRLAKQQIDGIPGAGGLRDRIDRRMQSVRTRRLSSQLSAVVEQLRMLDEPGNLQDPAAQRLHDRCMEIWRQRRRLAGRRSREEPSLGVARTRADLLDLGILTAQLHAAGNRSIAGHQRALAILDEAESLFGSSAALEVQRLHHALAAGLPQRADAARRRASRLTPVTAWEHLALGRWLLSQDQPQQARSHFQTATELRPDLFWPHFYLAKCAFRLRQYEVSAHESSVCIALAPRQPQCYYNRALALAALGQADDALRDLDRTVELAPTLQPAIQLRKQLQP